MTTPTPEQDNGELADLAAKVATYTNSAPSNPFVQSVTAEAVALVDEHIGRTATVPGPVRVRAVVEVAAELFWRQQARNGLATFDGGEAGPEVVHIGTDPMRAVRPILRPYLPGGFA